MCHFIGKMSVSVSFFRTGISQHNLRARLVCLPMIVPKVVKMGVYIFQEDKDSLIVEGATRPGFPS